MKDLVSASYMFYHLSLRPLFSYTLLWEKPPQITLVGLVFSQGKPATTSQVAGTSGFCHQPWI